MSEIERLTITLPAEMAARVRHAVEAGDYASSSEVVREALRGWEMSRAIRAEELAALKRDIDLGLKDIAAGRIVDFNLADVIEMGRQGSASRSRSG